MKKERWHQPGHLTTRAYDYVDLHTRVIPDAGTVVLSTNLPVSQMYPANFIVCPGYTNYRSQSSPGPSFRQPELLQDESDARSSGDSFFKTLIDTVPFQYRYRCRCRCGDR